MGEFNDGFEDVYDNSKDCDLYITQDGVTWIGEPPNEYESISFMNPLLGITNQPLIGVAGSYGTSGFSVSYTSSSKVSNGGAIQSITTGTPIHIAPEYNGQMPKFVVGKE